MAWPEAVLIFYFTSEFSPAPVRWGVLFLLQFLLKRFNAIAATAAVISVMEIYHLGQQLKNALRLRTPTSSSSPSSNNHKPASKWFMKSDFFFCRNFFFFLFRQLRGTSLFHKATLKDFHFLIYTSYDFVRICSFVMVIQKFVIISGCGGWWDTFCLLLLLKFDNVSSSPAM